MFLRTLLLFSALCCLLLPTQAQQKAESKKPANLKEAIAVLRPLLEKDNYREKKWTDRSSDIWQYWSYEVIESDKALTIIYRRYSLNKDNEGLINKGYYLESLSTESTIIPFDQIYFKGLKFSIEPDRGGNRGKSVRAYDRIGNEFVVQSRQQTKSSDGLDMDEIGEASNTTQLQIYSTNGALLPKINAALQDVLRFAAKPEK